MFFQSKFEQEIISFIFSSHDLPVNYTAVGFHCVICRRVNCLSGFFILTHQQKLLNYWNCGKDMIDDLHYSEINFLFSFYLPQWSCHGPSTYYHEGTGSVLSLAFRERSVADSMARVASDISLGIYTLAFTTALFPYSILYSHITWLEWCILCLGKIKVCGFQF
jgi:hypothetical protein